MTEAVFLALIALVSTVVNKLFAIALVELVLRRNPAKFLYNTKHGQFEVEFDHEADE